MVWGFLAASLAKTAVRTVAREVASGPRKDGAIAGPATEPQPVRFVVPVWFVVWGGFFLVGAALAVLGQLARVAGGHASAADAAGPAIFGALLCGLPGVGLAVHGGRGVRRKRRMARVQALANRPGGVAIGDLSTELGISPAAARALAEEALRDEHVIGRIDEMDRLAGGA